MRAWKKLTITGITIAVSAWVSGHVPLTHDQQLWLTSGLTGLLAHLFHVAPEDQVLANGGSH